VQQKAGFDWDSSVACRHATFGQRICINKPIGEIGTIFQKIRAAMLRSMLQHPAALDAAQKSLSHARRLTRLD
jgi:hypothetical protein